MEENLSVVLPGQPIRVPQSFAAKSLEGAYLHNGLIRASLLGVPTVVNESVRIKQTRWHAPTLGSEVLGSITRLSPLQAVLSITVVDGVPLPYGEEFSGVIRVQDVRATEKDKLKISHCFRASDVVKATVLSLGDSRSYFLTTACNDLGVIFATSEAGCVMEPVSWQEMRCPQTGKYEKRKCAKPDKL